MRNERQKLGQTIVSNSGFVSPKDPSFIQNIEVGVVRLVLACMSKGLKTVSSCQGHPQNREITLAFKSQIDLIRFKEIVPDYRLTETTKSNHPCGKGYTYFLTVWVDDPDVTDKTHELEQRIVELYSPSYNN